MALEDPLAATHRGDNMTWRELVPNSLTLLRLGMAPIFPFAPASWHLPMLVVALLTEYLDGELARRLDGCSDFGRVLDPIADKLFVGSVMLVLVMEGYIEPWLVVLVMFRDITIVLAACWFFLSGGKRDQAPRVEASLLGKVATAFQIFFLIAVLISKRADPVLLVPTVALSIVAALSYTHRHADALVPSRRAA